MELRLSCQTIKNKKTKRKIKYQTECCNECQTVFGLFFWKLTLVLTCCGSWLGLYVTHFVSISQYLTKEGIFFAYRHVT